MSIIAKKTLVDLNTLLILLFPFALVSGPLIPEIFLFIIVVSFFYFVLSEKKTFYFNNNFAKIFLLFFLIINISSFYNFNFISLKSSLFYFRFGFFSLAVFFFLNINKKLIPLMFLSMTTLILILLFDSSIQFFLGKNLLGFEKDVSGRVSSFFGDELVLGSFVSKFFLFYLVLFYSNKFSENKIYLSLIIFTFFLIIFYAASRTSLASFILSVLLFLFLLKDTKLILKLLFLFTLSIYILSQFTDNNFKRIFVHTKYQMFEEYSSFNFLSQRHMLHLGTAYNIFKENKIIGAGPKSFRILCDDKKYIPHNYIQKTSSVFAKDDGILEISIEAMSVDVDNNIWQQDLNTNLIFDINNLIKTKNNNFKNLNQQNIINIFYDKEYTELKNKAKLMYQDGSHQNINFFTNVYYIKIDEKKFKKGQEIFKFKPLYKNGCNTHPHNFLIQILSETGLVGFIIYIFVGLYFIFGVINFLFGKKIMKKIYKYKIDFKICLIFISYLIFFLPIFPSGNFFNNWLSMIIYFPMGFLLYFIDKNKTIKI
jgi:O-antigen ligase